MYAKGMATRYIATHLENIYGFEASPTLISGITDKITPVAKEWQNRPLEPVYPIIFMNVYTKFLTDSNIDALCYLIDVYPDFLYLRCHCLLFTVCFLQLFGWPYIMYGDIVCKRKDGKVMEYILAPKSRKNGAFQNGGYRSYARKTVYRVLSVSAVCGLFPKTRRSPLTDDIHAEK